VEIVASRADIASTLGSGSESEAAILAPPIGFSQESRRHDR
jgi:hypothetical protein